MIPKHQSRSVFSLSRVTALPIGTVRIGGWIGERYQLTWQANLLALNWNEDFLRPFQEKKSARGFYVGLGKTFESLSRYAAHTQNPQLLQQRRRVLDAMLACQEPDGYLGTYPAENRISWLWDVHELSYILFSLVADWKLFGEVGSMDAARKLGHYLLNRLATGPLPTEINEPTNANVALELTMLGLDRALLALHEVTQDASFLDFCVERLGLPTWDLPIVEGRHGALEGHAYAYLCRCLAQLDLREILHDDRLLAQSRRVVDFLTRQSGLLLSGSFSVEECWDSTQVVTGDIGETCATAYWIRLCARLLSIDPDGIYGDLMERAIYNALFAAQSPDGRRLRYYVPLEGKRVYWDRDTYCCPGNFRRILSEFPELIYFTTEAGFLVNLYSASSAKISIGGGAVLTVEQQTDYPNSGHVKLTLAIERPKRFTVSLRIPSWCQQFTARVNARERQAPVQNGFLHIDREWNTGDFVELILELPWRLVAGGKSQQGRAALARGPVLFCVNSARNQIDRRDLSAFKIALPDQPAPEKDSSLRSGGLSCPCGCLSHLQSPILFTEFADPDGETTYFQPSPTAKISADELGSSS